MVQRLLVILVLGAIASQSLLGGLRGRVSVCFSRHAEHHHTTTEASAHHSHTCDHHSHLPTPMPGEAHDRHHHDDCPCTYVEIEAIDFGLTLRELQDDAPPPVGEGCFEFCWLDPLSGLDRTAPPVVWKRTDDPGGGDRLRVVRSVRLLL